jgi:hypothetical protein
LVVIETVVGLVEVHYCVVVGDQVIEVLISENELLLYLAPEFTCRLLDLCELCGWVDSESTDVAVVETLHQLLVCHLPCESGGIGKKQFHTDSLHYVLDLRDSRQNLSVTTDASIL